MNVTNDSSRFMDIVNLSVLATFVLLVGGIVFFFKAIYR
jgi:hypothetical protein